MLTSNRIILTDVDGVLLEWENHFTNWMLQRSYFNDKGKKVYPYTLLDGKENTYEMAERFGLTIPEIRKEIREFNKSAWMATQCMSHRHG
jgi:FMN phosphatase YigB (HAD superfamily)